MSDGMLKDESNVYGWNDGSSLGGTTWSTPTDDDSGYDPSPSMDYDEDEREL